MAKKGKVTRKVKRPIIKLMCTVCKRASYSTRKNPKNTPDRLERSKFCTICKKRTPHKETK
ncbi:TPA: 50S ribosomal protein L33 [Patescibacteria group bacterium]|uniref:Large ribosomal subunit protein bL33 n=2 Tax=Bacteria division Kazan-3B-28 TaxID=1798534 RepID=A0A0G1X6Z5_UNCK3|nr:MAG: 50S ribosomal protein L33, large subunit ribosomal protein L33 [candidate division Kazan bacterium GW2011_GWA1_50_15]KKW25430.1 MAG: 50S ribosomal protein L33 [candidate division Kazan bacterium GW2011_GWC1_52_13]KKW26736.1 MAG: 50S ribosomal protein L33 [candidate division Kazan bacterium GW2011_GWB1_52_7]HAV65734.1 50S ribosomal protein L33 [Patescibacteria group bacterium]HCL47459.1 50S ribosomal protein L33 [Patescibacteria group bacterium]